MIRPHYALCTWLGVTLFGCADRQPPTEKLPQTEFKATAEVLASADAYANALPWGDDRAAAHDRWLTGFFAGFTAHQQPEPDPDHRRRHHEAGRIAGHVCRQTRPNDLDHFMVGFGYQPVTLEGQLTVGFEASYLRPTRDPTQKWWVHWMSAAALEPIEATNRRAQDTTAGAKLLRLDRKVRVVGYLSEAGTYGHLGACQHELRVIAVELLNG